MSFSEASNDGTLNGTTEVILVSPPSPGFTRIVKNVNINIRDTANVVITVYLKNGVNTRFLLGPTTFNPGDTLVFGEEDFTVLDTTSKSIAAVMAAPPATLNPDFVACWADKG